MMYVFYWIHIIFPGFTVGIDTRGLPADHTRITRGSLAENVCLRVFRARGPGLRVVCGRGPAKVVFLRFYACFLRFSAC